MVFFVFKGTSIGALTGAFSGTFTRAFSGLDALSSAFWTLFSEALFLGLHFLGLYING